MSGKPFRYPLEPLLRKRRSEWKTVKMEEATAFQVVQRRDAQLSQTRDRVDEVERLMRDARGNGRRIDTTQQQLLSSYLSQQLAALEQRQQALKRAQDVHDQVKTSLEGIVRGIKSLEKHRTNRETEHFAQESSSEQKRLDELWLLRQRKED